MHSKNVEEWITFPTCNSCDTFLIWAGLLHQGTWAEQKSYQSNMTIAVLDATNFQYQKTGGEYALEILAP